MSKIIILFTLLILFCNCSVGVSADQDLLHRLTQCTLHESTWMERRKALLKLKELSLGRKDGREILFDTARKATCDQDGIVRSEACAILGYQSTRTNTIVLIKALQHEFELPRDDRGAKNDLRMSRRQTWWRDVVVRSCVESLVAIGADNIECIESAYLKNQHNDAGYALLGVLNYLGQRVTVESLGYGIKSASSDFIKVFLIRALGKMGDRRAIPLLRDCLHDDFQIQTKELTLIYPIRNAAQGALYDIEQVK